MNIKVIHRDAGMEDQGAGALPPNSADAFI